MHGIGVFDRLRQRRSRSVRFQRHFWRDGDHPDFLRPLFANGDDIAIGADERYDQTAEQRRADIVGVFFQIGGEPQRRLLPAISFRSDRESQRDAGDDRRGAAAQAAGDRNFVCTARWTRRQMQILLRSAACRMARRIRFSSGALGRVRLPATPRLRAMVRAPRSELHCGSHREIKVAAPGRSNRSPRRDWRWMLGLELRRILDAWGFCHGKTARFMRRLLQTFENGFLAGGDFFRRVAKCAGNLHGLGCFSSALGGFERKRAAVIVADVVGIFQDVAGQAPRPRIRSA